MRVALLADANSANTASWAQGLRQGGHDVHVVTFHPGDIPGIPVHAVGQTRILGKLRYLAATSAVRQVLQRIKPDIVVGYYLSSYGLVASLAWRGPLALAAAGSDLRLRRSQPAVRFLARRGDLFLAWAEHMAVQLEAAGVDRNRILVLHRGIDLTTFSPASASPRHDSVRLISTRSLKPIYRVELVVMATAELARIGCNVECTIVGDGPIKASLQTLAREIGVADRISFAGRQPSASVATLLRASDIYVSMSKADGASSSLFEAMGCGVFPIVSAIAASREWIRDAENGLLVNGDSSRALTEAISLAAASPEFRRRAIAFNLALAGEKLDQLRNVRLMSDRFNQIVERKMTAK